ncbi:hypothetical protein KNT65_gp084 [Escherichia phage EcS1]|uniref:Uncharacterized protein n=1 Tax=Escherichia phage EcS1 TaxID=2083276 RepID=A0A2Z5ZCK7_9CAUD|nr:hypothetical protein KNT65_gp084 [Escherichia phage EcS1]BBC78132.1 Hypothetical protein [Escherichia phage EcS1]
MTKQKKRKEYLNVAERMMLELIVSYYKEMGVMPTDSQLKRTCTIGRDKAISMIYSDVHQRIQSDRHLYHVANHPDFDAGLKDTIKEIESDVQDFWLRRKHS